MLSEEHDRDVRSRALPALLILIAALVFALTSGCRFTVYKGFDHDHGGWHHGGGGHGGQGGHHGGHRGGRDC